VPAQQRSVASHDVVASLQTEPAGLQAWPWSQRPTAAPGSLAQCTFVGWPDPPSILVEPALPGAPQQSASVWQSSPVGWHPLGGWQIRMPVGAYGRQDLLQQLPPHCGSVPPVVAAEHAWPAGVQPPAPEALTTLQVPSVAPAAMVHLPPQQSRSAEQASPFWVQKDAATEQRPFWQRPEQQSPFFPQGLPDVLQLVLSGVQVPPPHLPPQHWASVVQAALSAVHWLVEHLPSAQEKVQHSLLALQAAPDATQDIAAASQAWLVVLQLPDWQSLFPEHVAPPGS
jgi:hypothetical protein